MAIILFAQNNKCIYILNPSYHYEHHSIVETPSQHHPFGIYTSAYIDVTSNNHIYSFNESTTF